METKQTRDLSNGFYFGDSYLAREMIGHIFCFADVPTLAKCRLVCRLWQSVVEEPLLWKKKTLMAGKPWPKIPVGQSFPWMFYGEIYRKQPYERNLIKNPCGADRFKHWKILFQRGYGFTIENPPVGSDNVPDEVVNLSGFQNSCYATSYRSCSKEQVIVLKDIGVPDKVMDNCKPSILVSEWYTSRFDCSCLYENELRLLDKQTNVVAKFPFSAHIEQWEGGTWHKMEQVICDYPAGVRSFKFYHGGTQFWGGQDHGSKFTAASVMLLFDREPLTKLPAREN